MFTLGRTIDIQYSTNRFILMITLISAIIGMVMLGDFFTGLRMAGTIFLTWVFSREADPKWEYASFVGVAIAFLYSFLSGAFLVSFLELAFLLLLLRLINRTCGEQPTLVDAGVILGIAVYLYYSSSNPIYLIIYVIGLFVSQVFKEHELLNILLAAGAGFSLGYLIYFILNNLAFSSPILSPIILLGLAFLYIAISYFDHTHPVHDDNGDLINPVRIVRSQLFFAFSVLILTFYSDALLGNMIVYFATMAGIIIYRPLNKIFHIEK